MGRRTKMGIAEALRFFNFDVGTKLTKEIISKKFHKLAFTIHTDKNKSIDKHRAGVEMAKLSEAKKVLLENIDALPTIVDEITKTKSSVFVDFIKTVDIKGRKNPFGVYTQYKKGKGK